MYRWWIFHNISSNAVYTRPFSTPNIWNGAHTCVDFNTLYRFQNSYVPSLVFVHHTQFVLVAGRLYFSSLPWFAQEQGGGVSDATYGQQNAVKPSYNTITNLWSHTCRNPTNRTTPQEIRSGYGSTSINCRMSIIKNLFSFRPVLQNQSIQSLVYQYSYLYIKVYLLESYATGSMLNAILDAS